MNAPCPAKRISFASYGRGDAGRRPALFVANVSVDLDDDEAGRLLREAWDDDGPREPADRIMAALNGRVLIDLTDRRLEVAHHLAGWAVNEARPTACASEVREDLKTSCAGMLMQRFEASRESFAAEVRMIDARLARDPAGTLVDLFGGRGSLMERLLAREAPTGHRRFAFERGGGLLRILDRDGAHRAKEDHMAVWGGVHRVLEADWTTEEDEAAVHSPFLPRATAPAIRSEQPGWNKPWSAWKVAKDSGRFSRDGFPALELAWRVARMAAAHASRPSNAPAAALDRLAPRGLLDDGGEATSWARPSDAAGSEGAGAPPTIDTASTLADSRDRLLLKMHSRDCSLGLLASLRIEHLHVNRFGDVYDRTDDDYPYPIYSMDRSDRDDFWRLARHAGSIAGWLFADFEAPYGRRRLGTAEAERIVSLARFTFENELEDDGGMRDDPWRWKRED